MDVRVEIDVRLVATRTGAGFAHYELLEAELMRAINRAAVCANEFLKLADVPFTFVIAKKEVVSR